MKERGCDADTVSCKSFSLFALFVSHSRVKWWESVQDIFNFIVGMFM